MFTPQEKEIISRLQGDLPLSPTPYGDLAKELGLKEEELIQKIKEFKEKGILRRVGTILRHHRAGYTANGMCAWKVPQEKAEEIGKVMATFPQASHVYHRPTYPDWPYSLFTMLHGRTKEECEKVAREISLKTGIKDYILLYSTREFKKTSMKYF